MFKFLFKRARLVQLKKLRKKRDEVLTTDNSGRARQLVYELPGVRRITSHVGWRSSCEVEFSDGFEFKGFGDSELQAIQDVITNVYLKSITYVVG